LAYKDVVVLTKLLFVPKVLKMAEGTTVLEFKKPRRFNPFRRRSPSGRFGLGKKGFAGLFLAGLLLCLVLTAVVEPGLMYGGFFAPVVVLLSLLFALGAKKLLLKMEVHLLHRELVKRSEREEKGGQDLLH
jgi:hypothetical protein